MITFVTTNENPIDSYISTVFPQIRFNVSSPSTPKSTESQNAINQTVPDGFLVWSPSCQMLAMEPLARDVMKLFHRGKQTVNNFKYSFGMTSSHIDYIIIEKYETCSSTEPLTYININFTSTEATLVFNDTPKWYASYLIKSTCCYQEITRSGSGKLADDSFK